MRTTLVCNYYCRDSAQVGSTDGEVGTVYLTRLRWRSWQNSSRLYFANQHSGPVHPFSSDILALYRETHANNFLKSRLPRKHPLDRLQLRLQRGSIRKTTLRPRRRRRGKRRPYLSRPWRTHASRHCLAPSTQCRRPSISLAVWGK